MSKRLLFFFLAIILTPISFAQEEMIAFDHDLPLDYQDDGYLTISSGFVVGNRLIVPSKSAAGLDIVQIIDLNTGDKINTLSHPKSDEIKWINFGRFVKANENHIVVSAYTESHYPGLRRQGEIHIYDAKTFEHLREIRSPENSRAFGFGEGQLALNNTTLVTTDVVYDADRPVSVDQFDLESGKLIRTLRDPNVNEGGVFGIGAKLGSPGFGTGLLINETHLILNSGTQMTAPTLVDLTTGKYSSPFELPTEFDLSDFIIAIDADDQHIVVAGSIKTDINIMFGTNASINILFVYDAVTGALVCSSKDPYPVAINAEPATLAAAKGMPTPYYGSGYGSRVSLSGDLLILAMDEYSATQPRGGALAVINKRTCEQLQIIEPQESQADTNFGLVFAASSTHLVVDASNFTPAGKLVIYRIADLIEQ